MYLKFKSRKVTSLSPPPIPKKTRGARFSKLTGFGADLAACGKGQVEGVRVFSNFSPVGSFPPKTSRLQPKRSVNPGPTLLLARFAEELRRSDAAR